MNVKFQIRWQAEVDSDYGVLKKCSLLDRLQVID